jgi:hypothetical protein
MFVRKKDIKKQSFVLYHKENKCNYESDFIVQYAQ